MRFLSNHPFEASEAYLELSQTSKVQLFASAVNGWPLTFFTQSFILDVQLGSEFTSSRLILTKKERSKDISLWNTTH